jgi:hypothetical protein
MIKQLPQVVGVAYFVSALYDGLVVFKKRTYPALANHGPRHGKRIFSKNLEALRRRTHLGGNYF